MRTALSRVLILSFFAATIYGVRAAEISVGNTSVSLTADITGTLPVANGGTGATTNTQNGILYGNGTSAIGALPQMGADGIITGAGGVPSTGTILGTANEITLTKTGSNIVIDIPTDPTLSGANITAIPAANISAGSLGTGVIASSVAVSGVGKNTCGSATISCRANIGEDGRITSVSSTTIAPAASDIAAGALGTGVIASSIAVNAVLPGSISVTAGVTATTGTFSSGQIKLTGTSDITSTGQLTLADDGGGTGTNILLTEAGGYVEVTVNNTAHTRFASTGGQFMGVGTTSPKTKIHMSSGTVTLDGNISPAINVLNGTVGLWSRTMAQLDTQAISRTGVTVFCSDCTLPDVCVSTGTTASQWRRIGTTTGCGSGN